MPAQFQTMMRRTSGWPSPRGLKSDSLPGFYDNRWPGRRPLERRAFQIQGDPVPVLHQGVLEGKREWGDLQTASLRLPVVRYRPDGAFVSADAFLSCFPLQSHLGNVLVDMKLIDIKDTLPVGFIPIQETVDTRM